MSVAKNAYGRLTFGGDDSDDCFGKPDYQLFQLTVLVFETVQRLFQLCVPVNCFEMARPYLLGSELLHCLSLGRKPAKLIVMCK
jgi:hypothetical protein